MEDGPQPVLSQPNSRSLWSGLCCLPAAPAHLRLQQLIDLDYHVSQMSTTNEMSNTNIGKRALKMLNVQNKLPKYKVWIPKWACHKNHQLKLPLNLRSGRLSKENRFVPKVLAFAQMAVLTQFCTAHHTVLLWKVTGPRLCPWCPGRLT